MDYCTQNCIGLNGDFSNDKICEFVKVQCIQDTVQFIQLYYCVFKNSFMVLITLGVRLRLRSSPWCFWFSRPSPIFRITTLRLASTILWNLSVVLHLFKNLVKHWQESLFWLSQTEPQTFSRPLSLATVVRRRLRWFPLVVCSGQLFSHAG